MSNSYGRRVLRFSWLIVCVLVLSVAVTAPLSLLFAAMNPTWRATAMIRISDTRAADPLEPDTKVDREELQDFILSQAMVVKERAIIRRALQEPQLRETEWFRRNYDENLKTLEEKLQEDVQVKPIRNTCLIEVSFEYSVKRDVAPVVNSVVKVYLEYVGDMLKEETRSHLGTLQGEEARLKRVMQLRKDELSQLSQNIPGLALRQNEPSTVSQRLMDLSRELTRADLEEATLRLSLADMETARDEGRLQLTTDEQATIRDDQALADLETQRTANENTRRQLLQTGVAADAAQIKQLDAAKAEIVRRMDARRAELTKQLAERRLDSIRQAHEAAASRCKVLAEKVADAAVMQKDLDRKISDFRAAESEYLDVQGLYKGIVDQRRKLEIILSTPENLSIRGVAEALEPLEPVQPDVLPLILPGSAIGLGLGLLITLIVAACVRPRPATRPPMAPIIEGDSQQSRPEG